MTNFNHATILWIVLWAIAQGLISALFVYVLWKLTGHLKFNTFAAGEIFSASVGLLVFVHYKTGWMALGVLIGIIVGALIQFYFFPREEDWREHADF